MNKIIQKIKNWWRGYSRVVEIDSRKVKWIPIGDDGFKKADLPPGRIVKVDQTDVVWKVYYK